MKRTPFIPWKKIAFLVGIPIVYVLVGIALLLLVQGGVIERLPPTPLYAAGDDSLPEPISLSVGVHLRAAETFFRTHHLRDDGHILLYRLVTEEGTSEEDSDTNSEAASYFLLWAAQAGDKEGFDRELRYIEEKMVHPVGGYLQWRLTEEGRVETDGSNIASDADLRAIKALLIAERRWGDPAYGRMIDTLAQGLERTAITKDGLLAPYGGMSGETPWTTEESWLSYGDFTVFRDLATRRGAPWTIMFQKMKSAVLGAQLQNGLYNSQLTVRREYGNGIDGGGYSINSLWIMDRNAESGDPELVASANRSLAFYKEQFARNAEIDTLYGSNGDALSPGDAPWVYALVGRAAISLGDREFSDAMIEKLVAGQEMDCASPNYGALYEGVPGAEGERRVGQFTMQEAILTMQAYQLSRGGSIASSKGLPLLDCDEDGDERIGGE